MVKNRRLRRELVELTAYDANEDVVEQVTLSSEDYYEGLHELIDKDAYRARKRIVAIEGRIYGPSGTIEQEFRNRYSESGAYMGGRATHADGTVTED